jgi:putative transposase
MPGSLEQLDLLLLTVARARTIHPDGIHLQSLRYLDPVLAAYVGESVIIRYDARDMAEIRIFRQGAGSFWLAGTQGWQPAGRPYGCWP